MLRVLTIGLCLSSAPAFSDTVFDRLTGHWALPFTEGMRCSENPHYIVFTPDRKRATFRWSGPMINYLGEVDHEAGYTVLSYDSTSITMTLDGEARRTSAGDAVVWILLETEDIDGYCWGRTD